MRVCAGLKCGEGGEVCCAGNKCEEGLECDDGKCKPDCGEKDQPVCTGVSPCTSGLEPVSGICQECGDRAQACCKDGEACKEGYECHEDACKPECGEVGQKCCQYSDECDGDLECVGQSCQECGGENQPVCSDDGVLPCNDGLEDHGSICQTSPECGDATLKGCTDYDADCNKWLPKTDFVCEEILTKKSPGLEWCHKDCMMDDECTVATYVVTGDGDLCTLKKCGAVELESPVVAQEESRSFKFCTEPCNDDDLVLVDGYCRMCGAAGQACCAEDTCDGSSLYCQDGKCAECGKQGGRMCFNGEACDPGLVPYANNICSCGGEGQNCCDGSCDEDGLTCDPKAGDHEFGQCQPCGGKYNLCCDGNCNGDDLVCDRIVKDLGECKPCGGEYEQCCEGQRCNGQRVCRPYGTCDPCGGNNELACSEPPCADGCESGCESNLMMDPHGTGRCVMNGVH